MSIKYHKYTSQCVFKRPGIFQRRTQLLTHQLFRAHNCLRVHSATSGWVHLPRGLTGTNESDPSLIPRLQICYKVNGFLNTLNSFQIRILHKTFSKDSVANEYCLHRSFIEGAVLRSCFSSDVYLTMAATQRHFHMEIWNLQRHWSITSRNFRLR